MKQFTKACLVSLLFFVFFFALGAYNFVNFGEVSGNSDFVFHWSTIHDLSLNPNYPHVYHYVFQFFGQNKLVFYTENLLLICLAIPLLIFYATRTWWGTLIYFMGVSLPHMWLYGATYPQAFAFLFLTIYLAHRKNPYVFAICGVLASLIHHQGVYLFAIVLVAEVIDFLLKNKFEGWVKQVKVPFAGATVLATQKFADVPHYLFYLVTQISPMIWFYAKAIFKQPFYLILAVVPLFMLNYDARIISLTEIALLFVVTPEIQKSKHKNLIMIFLSIQLIFFLLEFAVGTANLVKS